MGAIPRSALASTGLFLRTALANTGLWNGRAGDSRSKPAKANARRVSGARMKYFQQNPLRRFSAIASVMPRSIAITSGETQPVWGLKASAKPYRPQTRGPPTSSIRRKARRHSRGANGNEPPGAQGTTVPSSRSVNSSGPPQLT